MKPGLVFKIAICLCGAIYWDLSCAIAQTGVRVPAAFPSLSTDSRVPPPLPGAEQPSDADMTGQPQQIGVPQPSSQGQTRASAEPAPGAASATEGLPDRYFDSEQTTIAGPMADQALRQVDPQTERAARYIVVKKDYDAESGRSIFEAANRALQLERYDAALDLFNQLHEKNPRDPRVLMGKAVALQNLGRVQAAIATYEALLNVTPDSVDAMINMLGLMRESRPAFALKKLLRLREDYPNHPGVTAQLASMHAELGNMGEALRYYGIASSLEPRMAGHVFNMAVINDRLGSSREAVSLYEDALEIDAVYGSSRSVPRELIYDRPASLR